jgi:hypothetical protein
MAILVTMIAAGVAILTLIVGAADQLLDARRPLATLSVLGTDELTLAHVLRRQLSAGSIVAIVGGVIAGIALLVLISLTSEDSEFDPGFIKLLVASTAGTSVIAAALVSLASRVAARMLRPRLRAAIDPGNLRVG